MLAWCSRWMLVALLGASAALEGGCTDGGRRSALRFEAAPASGAGCGASPAPLRVHCAQLTLCENGDPSTCVALAPVGGPYPEPADSGMQSILVPAVGGSFRFDARVDPSRTYDVDVVAYGLPNDEGRSDVVGVGHTSRVRFDGSPATVWLYPTDGWTCPGNTSTRLRRAFHQSVALSNGDALILGGIAFESSVSLLANPTVALVPADESALVFDARTEEIVRVVVSGDASLLQRAFFEARWLDRTTDGKERVRLFGGVTGNTRAEFTLLSGRIPVNILADGFVPAQGVTVLYDPVARTLEIESPGSSFETIVETSVDAVPQAETPRPTHVVLVGAESSQPQFVTQVGRVPAGMAEFGSTLTSPRRGATLTPVPGGWLVIGGNIADAEPGLSARSVVLIRASDGEASPLLVPFEIVPSVLHTASVVNGLVVIAGGLRISGNGLASPVPGAPPQAPQPVLRAVRMTPAGDALELVSISGAASVPELIYHTSTRDESGRVIVVGGSTRMMGSQFHAASSVYAVATDEIAVQMLPSLRTGRFAHSAVLLTGGRLLVTGGLRRGADMGESSSSLYMVEEPELLVVRPADGPVSCEAGGGDAGPPDVGPPDAGPPDAPASEPMPDPGG
ncbi:MAG: hypothetical protein ACK5U8_14635 [Deltaproteobacteria bacterium]